MLKEYQEFCKQNWSPTVSSNRLYFAVGLAGEVGEVCEELKKCYRDDREYDVAKLRNEIGDVLWYLTNIATQAGLTLEEVMQANIEKLTARHGGTYKPGMSDSEVRLRTAMQGHTIYDAANSCQYRLNGPHIEKLTLEGKHIKFCKANEIPEWARQGLLGQDDNPPW